MEMQQESTFSQAGYWCIYPDTTQSGVGPGIAVVEGAIEDHVDMQGWPGGPHVISREDPGVAEHVLAIRLQITPADYALECPLAIAVETE